MSIIKKELAVAALENGTVIDRIPSEQLFKVVSMLSLPAPIDQYSSLLPPVGVWTVSQFQCGGPSSQNPYPSSARWAVTPPTT